MGESHEIRQAYFPTAEQRRTDDEVYYITATSRLFLFLKLNFVQPAAGCHPLCFTAWPARKKDFTEFIEVDTSEEFS